MMGQTQTLRRIKGKKHLGSRENIFLCIDAKDAEIRRAASKGVAAKERRERKRGLRVEG
jgi:hypothetical protein